MPTTDRKLRVLPCHASQDKPIVRESYERLFSESWIDPWLDEEGRLCYLLFGTGRVLEEAVLEVLRLMEFTAESYEDSESEFDVIFSSSEGRFLGEVEGKDSSAINIDKLSQLERNIQEDFQRDDDNEYADGVLFGNAYRLQPPAMRPNFFTENCCTGADRARISLS